MKALRQVLVMFSIFVSSVLLILPISISAFIDPHTMMKIIPCGTDGDVKQCADLSPAGLHWFYEKFHISWGPPVLAFVIAAAILMIALLIYVNTHSDNSEFGNDYEDWIIKRVLTTQASLILVSLGLSFYNEIHFSVGVFYQNATLNESALGQYRGWRWILMTFLPLFVFFVFDILSALIAAIIGAVYENLAKWWRGFQINQLKKAGLYDTPILLESSGRIQLVDFGYRMKFFPFPMLVVRKQVERSANISSVFPEMVRDEIRHSLAEIGSALREDARSTASARLDEHMPAIVRKEAERLMGFFMERTKETIDSLRRSAAGGDSPACDQDHLTLGAEILQKVSAKTLARFKHEITARAAEVIDCFQEREYLQILARSLQQEIDKRKDRALDVYPYGTKGCRTFGEKTVLIVEEPPLVRSLRFSGGFLGSEDYISEYQGGRIPLAFPYVIFVITFVRNSFSELRVFYSKRPVTSLDDPLYKANLPNINKNGLVCMGSFDLTDQTIAEQVPKIIAHFWGSQFNTDLSENYREARRNESRVGTFSRWVEESKKDPLFVLDASWCHTGTVNGVLEGFGYEKDTEIERIIWDSCSKTTGRFSEGFVEWLNSVSTEKLYQKAVVKDFEAELLHIYESLAHEEASRLEDTARNQEDAAIKKMSEDILGAVAVAITNTYEPLAKKIAIGENIDFSSFSRSLRRS